VILTEKNSMQFFKFPNLETCQEVIHGIFTRNCGFSKAPYNSLNVSYNVGDNKKCVIQNRTAISECLGEKELVFVNQVHGVDSLVFAAKEKRNNNVFNNAISKKSFQADALITDIRHKMLVIQVADCQAVLLYDPFKHVVANIHSGWKGSICNIIGLTIKTMENVFRCDPEHLIAGIGPSLGQCCAEFVNYQKEIPDLFHRYKNKKDHFDFWAASKDQLCNAGVLHANIYTGNICTKCESDLFFSFRSEKVTGRFASVIGLK